MVSAGFFLCKNFARAILIMVCNIFFIWGLNMKITKAETDTDVAKSYLRYGDYFLWN